MNDSLKTLLLQRQKVLETLKDEVFDDVISLASLASFGATIVLNFQNYSRSWHQEKNRKFVQKALITTEFDQFLSYCDSRTRVISDLDFEPAFALHPFIKDDPLVRFYACFPVKNSENEIIGLLHILDHSPRTLTPEQIQGLELIAKIIGDRTEKEFAIDLQRTTAEEAFHKQTEFLDTVLENLGDGVVACDADGKLNVFNRATREFHGLDSRGDIPSEKWSEYYKLLHADGKTLMEMKDIPLFRAFNGETLRDAEMVVESVDGWRRNILCSGRSIFRKDGSKLGALVTMHDITAIKNANAKVESTTKMLQALIDIAPAGIAVFDLNDNLVIWNPESEKMFGWKLEEVLNKPMPYLNEEHRERVKDSSRKIRASKTKVEGYGTRYRKDGSAIELKFSVLPLLDDKNELYASMALFIDMSDVKQRETSLLEANRALEIASVAKSEFLANMSHEIRTPLNGVIGMTDLVMLSELTSEQREQLQVAQTSAHNLASIVNDILDFSKMEAGKLEVENINFDLEQIVNEVHENLKTYAENKKLTLIKKIVGGPKMPVFSGDPERFRQVLSNLVSNAIKFSENGEVQTSVSFEKVDDRKTKIRVEIKDTGIGISKEVIGRLFQPFSQADSSTTRRFGGTGLGLSISKGLIDLMHGEIGVAESVIGSGSKFFFTLTLQNVNSINLTAPSVETVSEKINNHKLSRILMAEDNAMNQKIALAMLSKLGYTADVVEHGRAAVEALKKNKYDLILMDCQMPEMDGYEATRIIRSDSSMPNNITIIAVTANAMKGDREKCLDAGMSDYITKPVKVDVLKEILERYLAPKAS